MGLFGYGFEVKGYRIRNGRRNTEVTEKYTSQVHYVSGVTVLIREQHSPLATALDKTDLIDVAEEQEINRELLQL